jgi:malonate transporter
MVVDSLFPVLALVLAGRLLKHSGLTNEAFLRTSDRLIYFMFFPALLFWKIGGAVPNADTDWGLYAAAASAVIVVYLLSTGYIVRFGVSDYQAGSFSQSCYRFNTYIGVAVLWSAHGEAGIRQFGLLIALLIPLINLLAVSTLVWFSGKSIAWRGRVTMMVKTVISNPLILACISGIVYARLVNGFPAFVDNTFRLSSQVALPLALLSIGSVLTTAKVGHHLKLSLIAAVFKLLVLPAVGFIGLKAFHVSGVPFKVGMVFFTLPTSTALYILSAQLNSDTDLASASIALSTMLSFLPLCVALWI